MPSYAPNLTKLLNSAKALAAEENKPLTTVQLFCQIISSDLKIQKILERFDLSWKLIIGNISDSIPAAFPELFAEPAASEEVSEVIAMAEDRGEKDGFVDVEHLLLSICSSSTVRAWMEFSDVFPTEKFVKEVEKLIDFTPEKQEEESEGGENDGPPPNMMRFCENISAEIMMQDGPQIFGREKEISSILDTVVRAKKNNVLLVGDNGVGRKSICKGVAEKILNGRCSEFLQGKTVWQLDMTKFTAGASMYGALEARAESLARELDKEEDVILVIPNIHTTIGAGNREGSMDVANLIKPILCNPKIPVIGITTQADYKKFLEKDQSLVGSFEILKVEEPSKEEVRKILLESLQALQEYHLVNVEIPVLDEIINLCERYIPYKKFPEKAFDVLDALCAKTKNAAYTHPNDIIDLEDQISARIHPNLKQGTKEYAAIKKLENQWIKKIEKWGKKISNNSPVVSVKDLISAFAEKYKISENQLKQTQNTLPSDLADRLKEEVHGQNKAIEAVCDTLLCTKVGLRDTTKPLAKFLFVGSTSVGKSFLGKKISKYYFGDEKALLKIDMSEYQEKHSIATLTGAPPGFIGYEGGGKLTEYVKHNPSSVILFDEIEKAHPDVANILLQIMDDGCLTDAQGYRVDFTNTIIIITGNIGSGTQKKSMGFHNKMEEGENYLNEIKKHFRPEFLARLDDPIVFNELDNKAMLQILNDSLNKTKENLKTQKITLTIEPCLVNYLLEEAKAQNPHARNIQAIVRKTLEIPIAKKIMKDKPSIITAKINNKILELS